MAKKTLSNGDVEVQAWICTKDGHPGTIVYTHVIALDWLAAGFDIEITKITRPANGGDPIFARGVMIDWSV